MISLKNGFYLAAACALLTACDKYEEIVDAPYSEQRLYLPAAVTPNSTNGLYLINSVATAGQTFRYTVNNTARRLEIPIGVYRSGVNKDGAATATLTANSDTVSKLIANGLLTTGMLLPSSRFTLTPTVTLESGEDVESVILSVDLDYLIANPTVRHAIGLQLSSTDRAVNPLLSVAVVVIDPVFFTPVASFTSTVNAATKTVTFTNTSTNGVSWSWNFGDGSGTSTQRSPVYTYAASGTYTVTLTATGVLGSGSTSVRTMTVVIP